MTQNRTKELLPVLQAWAEGKTIQHRGIQTGNYWVTVEPEDQTDPAFHIHGLEWRVKPTPMRIKVVMDKDNNQPKRFYSDSLGVRGESERLVTFEQVIDEKEGT